MKVNKAVFGNLLDFEAGLRGNGWTRYARDEPLRGELFSRDQMEQHGKTLARSHRVGPGRAQRQLLGRLAENEGVLIEVRDLLLEPVETKRPMTPGGEWLLDNFYLIEEQIRTAKRHLPKGYSRELPRLLNGPSAGYPRVYDIALETIAHGDGRVDAECLTGFVAAYQSVSALNLGELWAIPIMLRLALIENLRRVGARLGAGRIARNLADRWASQMTEVAEKDPKSLILVAADMARSNPPMVSSFVAEFTRRLQGQSSALALPLTWMEQRLSESGLTIDQLVQAEHQQQAGDQVSISNSIGSLRFLGAMDWREFVETLSLVDRALGEDAGGVYGRMDFATRDRYRHAVEKIAKRSPLSEDSVARNAIQLARESAAENGSSRREAHVGFYLIDKGVPQLERAVKARLSVTEIARRTGGRFPLILFLGAVILVTTLLAGTLSATAFAGGLHGWALGLFGILTILCASHLAVVLANWLVTLLVPPHPLPRMDFSRGIPPESRTLAVIPTMLTSAQNIEDLAEALEVRFLANRDANLHFGLLTDFPDADAETIPEDEPLLQLAEKRIRELNDKYGGAKYSTFFLFHRPRRWNSQERKWLGYERKRGKLADLNSLLRGGSPERFSTIVGGTTVLSNVKYVITLDTDTQLPRDSARQFVGAMEHPLNRARYDRDKQRVCEGYGILQPRVAVSLPGANRSRYARLFGSEPGIDPYTREVSDVYQDLFGEGSYIGKGIYEVDAFELALQGRLPENRILSHDLLEGCYARAGLLSDVELVEEYPRRYSADVSRRHRWIRGDWQIARWLLPRVPGLGGRRQKNPLSALSRWKIFDNLRRSLVPSALTLLMLLGWTVLSPAWFWTLAAIGVILVPSLVTCILELLRKPDDALLRSHLTVSARCAARHLAQAAFSLACLPYEAFFSLDAIARTAVRLGVTRRRLLEWNPSTDPDRCDGLSLVASCRSMWIGPLLATAAGVHLALSRPAALAVVAPILGLWFASPAIAWWISRPLARREARLTVEQTVFLRRLTRKIWAFFEVYVGPEDHWLPPDNYQEHPVEIVAHRTSPTNMGLALLANLSAYDFGFIPAVTLIERTGHAFDTMESLERHKGHFYNWYDTKALKPLLPAYVSSVDSGNLAGLLLTLRPGLLELPDHTILAPQFFDGLDDTLRLLVEAVGKAPPAELVELQRDLAVSSRPTTLDAALQYLARLAGSASALVTRLNTDPDGNAKWWAGAVSRQCQEALDDLVFLSPWALLLPVRRPIEGLSAPQRIPTLREVAGLESTLLPAIEHQSLSGGNSEETAWLGELRPAIVEASRRARERIAAIERLALRSSEFSRMEYDFLYDKGRHLLAIGYNVSENRRDAGFYDLLASEARLATFVTIAQGQLPQESWFALGRLLVAGDGDPILLSWGGSMFEYLMPLVVMPGYENTLLDQTCKAAVDRQIDYGRTRGVPWGVSESGYNAVDVHLNYQYRSFGVPGLGLRRGLAEDLVIAPYASALALMVAPEEACLNLERLAKGGFEGRYGLYEAVDYTPSRQPRGGQSSAVVRSFMAHHQGMSLLALAYLLLDRPMQKRFESDPLFQATMLLLQERIPRATAFFSQGAEPSDGASISASPETPIRVFTSPDSPIPELQLLSNGRYHVMVTNAGGGYSRWKDIALTRWREDCTCDNWGTFCYLRDVASGVVWSNAYQPTRRGSERYEAAFSEARVEFRRRDHDIDSHTEIAVSPEDDIELRRITLTNRSRIRRVVDLTSYAEVVLGSPAGDALHPAFSNLFVQTEIISRYRAILCTRRPRSVNEPTPWMFHLLSVPSADPGEISYETDRLQFVGRGNTIADAQAMLGSAPLSGSQGSVLDPIVAIRYRVTLDPEESVAVNVVCGIGETRDDCLGLVEKYQDRHLADRVFELAWTHSQVVLRQLNATEADAQLYGRLASSILYANSSQRADPSVLAKNRRGQSGLWGYSISGDLPIVLLQIADPAHIDLVRQLIQAHAYWRLKGLPVDLVIWNEDHAGYRQLLHDQIMGLIAAGVEANVANRPGGIFVRNADQVSTEDRILFESVARAIITDSRGSLADQLNNHRPAEVAVPRLVPSRTRRAELRTAALPRRDLIFFNGLGGFTPDGREYVITTAPGQVTPAPWVNVLANSQFGTVISESGAACTWSENAHEFRLTPWNNDPVGDASGEAFYLRDEETGIFWSPTPLPSRGAMPYASRHGFGYSIFEHMEQGIRSELTVFVAVDASVKFTILKVRNESGRSRRVSATGYVEWVLGDMRAESAMHLVTEVNASSGALFARNPYNTEFTGRVAFFDVDEPIRTVSGDRKEFLGRNGTLRNPAAMSRMRLSGRMGASLDPCGAVQVPFELADGEERELIFRLGAGRNTEEATRLAKRFRGPAAAHGALKAVWQYWKRTLDAVQVETPDAALNVMANGWLLYQTLACRVWARSAFYQPGGAFGFRDQLQDVMALVHAEPGLAREHLLRAAAHQFVDGDVQHWWHPPSDRGVRTHCSDDYLWLPLATCRYVMSTGDTGVLDEPVHFLEGRHLNADEDSYYDLPGRSEETAGLYEHCVRAIKRGFKFGEHGLPLIGSGDWNDAMNLVGEHGKGESVWLGFFLYEVLMRFSAVACLRGDDAFAERCRSEAAEVRRNLEENGWDGAWYRRAYFDDGSPLGSATNPECQIDSVAQSWSVLSGGGATGRSRLAMEAVNGRLVRRDDGLIQLLDPPFDKSDLNPGYIKGYVPGVRENGGQYTHGAVWASMAFAALGDSRRAWELFDIINPVNHSRSPEAAATYKVEPYVVAADVYALAPHTGRGGWTWYTGSAGWMYRLIVESLLGLRLQVDKLRFVPCLPADWKGFKLHYRYRETVYHIAVVQTVVAEEGGVTVTGGKSENAGIPVTAETTAKVGITVTVDGVQQGDQSIPLVDDRRDHSVEVRIDLPPIRWSSSWSESHRLSRDDKPRD